MTEKTIKLEDLLKNVYSTIFVLDDIKEEDFMNYMSRVEWNDEILAYQCVSLIRHCVEDHKMIVKNIKELKDVKGGK